MKGLRRGETMSAIQGPGNQSTVVYALGGSSHSVWIAQPLRAPSFRDCQMLQDFQHRQSSRSWLQISFPFGYSRRLFQKHGFAAAQSRKRKFSGSG
jgi:hypothetical protein